MQSVVRRGILVALIPVAAMCGGKGEPGKTTVKVSPSAVSDEPIPPPETPALIPVPTASWSPAMIGAGKGEMLKSALQAQSKIALVLPRTQGVEELEARVIQMVQTTAPDVEIVSHYQAGFRRLLSEKDNVPYNEKGGDAVFLPPDHPLKREWASKGSPVRGADAVLAVRPVSLDAEHVRALRDQTTGDCDAFEKALAEDAPARNGYFSPFEQEATSRLKREFSRRLHAALGYWKDEISQARAIAAPGSVSGRCAGAYDKFLARYEACLGGDCPVAPRAFGTAGGVIGMIEESGAIPDSCPPRGMRDFAAEIHGLGAQATAEVLPSLSGAWTGEMVRVGALEALREGVADFCAPRHRRIDESAVAAAQQEVTAYLTALRDGAFRAEWERMGGQQRIPGVGVLRVSARVRSQGAGPAAELAAMMRRLRETNRCAQGTGKAYQVALLSPADARVHYMDVFFEEMLLCSEFPPR